MDDIGKIFTNVVTPIPPEQKNVTETPPATENKPAEVTTEVKTEVKVEQVEVETQKVDTYA